MNSWVSAYLPDGRDVRALRQQILELSWDVPFGMLTRPAFLQLCRALPPGEWAVAFIDLNDIGALNLQYGYQAVDDKVRMVFSTLNLAGEIPARWFSGDEIVVLFKEAATASRRMQDLHHAARREDLDFVYAQALWEPGGAKIETAIQALGDVVRKRKTMRIVLTSTESHL